MKKAIAILTALALVVAMAACGENVIPTKAPTEPETTAAAAQTTEAPKPAETTEAPKPVETTEAPKPVETTEAPKPVETTEAPKPVETTEAPKPVETTPAETTPEVTVPAETTPAAPVAGKEEYYKTYLGSEDMKPLSETVRTAMLVEGAELYAMTYGTGVVVIEAEGGKLELYGEESKLYAHIYLKPQDGNEGEDNWYVCEIPEGEDPFDSFGGSGDILTGVDPESAVLTYLESFTENGVEYDRLLMTAPEGAADPDSPQEAYLTVKADTHEVVRMEMEMNDPENPDVVQGALIEFLEEGSLGIPEGITPEEGDYQTILMSVFMGMMTLMSDFM
ncbi:MAG: hypothetical protein J5496_05405 [Lachnospiraceae bacterium]|nr:hypothetical protein [Lachnospiraceae bacterium]